MSRCLQAVLDGRPVARNSSDPVTGEGLLNINLQRPLGVYSLLFEVLGLSAELHTNMTVTVAPCEPGETYVEGVLYACCTLMSLLLLVTVYTGCPTAKLTGLSSGSPAAFWQRVCGYHIVLSTATNAAHEGCSF
jgi:hypothetical protein